MTPDKKLWPSWTLIIVVTLIMAVSGDRSGEWGETAALAAFIILYYPMYWRINRWIDAQMDKGAGS